MKVPWISLYSAVKNKQLLAFMDSESLNLSDVKILWQACTTPAARKCIFWSLALEVAIV